MRHWLTPSIAALVAALLTPACATLTRPTVAAPRADTPTSAATAACVGTECGAAVLRIAEHTEVPVERNAPVLKGHPLTSVVVTQCNLIVAVYLTLQDGRLLRFDHTSKVPAEQLLQMAYTATRSERVEVSCNDTGVVGYEAHKPV